VVNLDFDDDSYRVDLSKGEFISGYPDHYHINGYKDGCPNPGCVEFQVRRTDG
jgi:hypothetical protein